MIYIDDAEILDILPYTMKGKYAALSLTLKRMRAYVNGYIGNMRFWADIDNAPAAALDAMAAELAAPFYSSDMTTEQKRAVVAAAFSFNSRLGTVSSLSGLLTAAFGGGEVKEWYEYGGEPYHFKLAVTSEPPAQITKSGYELLRSQLGNIKPLRSKLDDLTISRNVDSNIFVGMAYIKTYKRFVVPAAQVPDEERGFN